MATTTELLEVRAKLAASIATLDERHRTGAKLTEREQRVYDEANATIGIIDGKIAASVEPVSETRGVISDEDARNARKRGGIEGRANEPVRTGQVREWYNKAVDNGVGIMTGTRASGYQPRALRAEGTDRDINRYWAERMGLATQTVESRALLEDTAGSALAITPQSWVADYVDVLLPNTILGRVGARVVPMSTEMVNVPVFTSTVSPSWVAEAGSIALDANPAFAPLQLNAMGGFKDITLVSIEACQDAYIEGSLPGMLANAVAKKMAVVLDTSMFLGITGNTGVPGLVNESGFITRKQSGDTGTTGFAPVNQNELSIVAEQIRNKNAEPGAIVSNPSVYGTFNRLTGTSGFPMYFPRPSDVADLPWVYSANSALPTTETDPASGAPAQTGGTMSSFYMGDWAQYCVLGVHLELTTRILDQRYIDSGEIGIFSFVRYSVRFAHPETFVRTIGVLTT